MKKREKPGWRNVTVRNSLRQLWRTKVRTFLFLILFSACVLLVSVGGNLLFISMKNTEQMEGLFRTIGTVEQKPDGVEKKAVWDAEKETYVYENRQVYESWRTLSDLELEGVEYLSGPERRPYYAAYVPDLQILDDNAGWSNAVILEASPLEDCIPSGPVKMELKKVLFSYYSFNAPQFYYCDHFHKNPEMLYADKTYVMSLEQWLWHGWTIEETRYEHLPAGGLFTTQTQKDGTPLVSGEENIWIQEITEGFWQSEDGKRWMELAKAREMSCWSVPVTPTGDLYLMMPFYQGDACIIEGREFTQEEYDQGTPVCLISRRFAVRNGLTVGDTIHLPLRSANYADSASIGMENELMEWHDNISMEIGLLRADGKAYPTFWECDYTICGIYDLMPGAFQDPGYTLHDNEIIVPADSIGAGDEENIMCWGPMKGYTTSFQIPNGSIGDFMEAWNQKGISNVEIVFYDKGYSRLESGLETMKRTAVGLLTAGAMAALFLLLYFCHMLIARQKKRIAIERSLGMTKWECTVSLLSGILLIALLGSLAGSIGSIFITDRASERMMQIARYDRTYSDDRLGNTEKEEPEIEEALSCGESACVSLVCGGGMFLLAGAAALLEMGKSMGYEPLELLGSDE